MGKPAGRFGDLQSGHGCFPPTPCIKGSSNVKINKKMAMRMGDTFVKHCCPNSGCHPPSLMLGSFKVIINGRPAGRMGDATSCLSTVMIGSANVIVG